MDKLVSYKTIPTKGCKIVKFSHGGQYFALGVKNRIQVYETYIGNFNKTFPMAIKSEISNIWWYPNDKKLLAGSHIGNIWEFSLFPNEA
jgi:hypothetical protein